MIDMIDLERNLFIVEIEVVDGGEEMKGLELLLECDWIFFND